MTKVEFKLPPIADKVASIFAPHKTPVPMFNQPLPSGCPHHRISRLLYAIFLSLLIAMAIPVVTLKASTYSFIEENRDMGFVFEITEDDGTGRTSVAMAALPRMLHHTPAKLALVAAVLSICFGLAHLGFVIVDWKDGKRTQAWAFRRNIMFLHIMLAILVLFALVSIYVTHRSTSHFRDGYVNFRASRLNSSSNFTSSSNNSNEPEFFRYNIGTFDLETWSCELKDVRGAAMVQSDYAMQCSIELAGRAVMIPFVVLAWIVAGTGIWGLVGGGRRGPDGERVRTAEVDLEMGKMNAL
ncbi:hypothetical protein BDU57DRAFT_553887 [Ampelomyces quisqualis]|uniref:Uncharacterized protein n=1 Tax=Ampelomyces quisqualis TaxID=50730 RepID=A0A6A5R380_AMPQU|nr:hypothetical protein BDU57DRAFT_553887 [Ampelomyces quisqualis]